ncbi:MAG: class I SAM-dependent methyltransferase [Candidatus Marinimicrobia bacterium]|nr:class I SAM-dependent methyltransferase [FCB group bacterium]MBL7025576.1 class I SAM-dependent methyltransferase [Candidatus Neomarinimicrobiota bacterium]
MPDKQNIQTIQPYQRLAAYYDTLMDYINYDIWVDDIEALVAPYEPDKTWLDISCGTGSMALKLARRGINMTAIDLSEHMIEIARNKALAEKLQIEFGVGNMVNFTSAKEFDVIINLHDGLNYLLETSEIELFLRNTFTLLKPGGILLFDVVTPLLCQTHFRGYREIFSDEYGGYERYTNYDPDSQLAESVFTLKTDREDTVDVESHIQKAYEQSDVEKFCTSSDYKWWKILDDETLDQPTPQSERFIVMLRKTA